MHNKISATSIPCSASHNAVVEQALIVAHHQDDLCEQYPENYQRYYSLVPSIEFLPVFLEWVAPRHHRIRAITDCCWTTDGLSDAEVEWLAEHGVHVSAWVKEIFDEDLRDDD